MKGKLLVLLGLLPLAGIQAQDYQPLTLTGYNADVVANGVGSAVASTTIGFDDVDYALMSTDYQLNGSVTPPAFALPMSGVLTTTTAGLTYQLASYTGNNSLRVPDFNSTGTLTLTAGVNATRLYVLTASGSGSATISGTVHFSDGSSQAFSGGTIPDWFFSTALPVVISGIGRVNRLTDVVENPAGDPRLYQYEIGISAANQTKTITSIDFTKTSSTEGTINVMAVSAQLLGTCPAPVDIAVSNVTFTSAIVSWNSPPIMPEMGYEYYLASDGIAPTASTPATNDAGTSPLVLNDLTPGVTYCIWLRSRCGDTEFGPWSQSVCFTPGEIIQTNPNNIPTLYAAATVDVTTTTTCPGTLSIDVPAGYHIASVATSYQMQTALNGWMSEQRSLLVCTTSGQTEASVSSGVGGFGGTYTYDRSNIAIANNLSGTVNFELRAWRTYGGSGCNTDYNSVVAGTWTVTATLAEGLAAPQFDGPTFALFPNPANDAVTISGGATIREISICNMLGQEVLRTAVQAETVQVPITALQAGQYLVKIKSDSGQQVKKLVKS